MQQVIRRNEFDFTMNQAFESVINNCASVERKEGQGTWIHQEMIKAYKNLFDNGYVISAEAWQEGELVGGLYGVKLGKVFFGESMFSLKTNASKFAFIKLTTHLQKEGFKIIDCQIPTSHLMSLGACLIERASFIEIIQKHV